MEDSEESIGKKDDIGKEICEGKRRRKAEEGETEITEGLLLKIAIACAIIGTITLYMISGRIDINETDINKITSGQSDGTVVVSGYISKLTEKEKVLFIDLEKKEKIRLLLFKKDYLDFRVGDYIEVYGKVSDYEGKKELIADQVRFLGESRSNLTAGNAAGK